MMEPRHLMRQDADEWSHDDEAPAYRRHDTLPKGGIFWGGMSVAWPVTDSIHVMKDEVSLYEARKTYTKCATYGCEIQVRLVNKSGYCRKCHMERIRKKR